MTAPRAALSILLCLAASWSVVACGDPKGTPTPSPAGPGAEAPPPVTKAETTSGAAAHRCERDDQCVLDCELGAVNGAWLDGHRRDAPPPECGDGCTSPGHEPPRCVEGTCVAFRSGRRHDACTQRPVP